MATEGEPFDELLHKPAVRIDGVITPQPQPAQKPQRLPKKSHGLWLS
jgi:hypothetical protein